jgi:hypothetical protein
MFLRNGFESGLTSSLVVLVSSWLVTPIVLLEWWPGTEVLRAHPSRPTHWGLAHGEGPERHRLRSHFRRIHHERIHHGHRDL